VLLAAGGVAGIEIIGRDLPRANIIHQAREILHGTLEDEFGSYRGFTWKRAVARVPYQPLLGSGADTFYYTFGQINQQESRETVQVVFDKAHNDFIQVLMCFGIPGLLAYLLAAGGVVALSLKKAFNDSFLLAALGGALAYIITGFFGIDTVIITPIYWLMLGIARGRQLELKREAKRAAA
jgi:O-antigen ligase